jgi:large subunit ribosomal protein L24
LSRELRIDGKLTAGPIDADGKGALRLPADQPATIDLEQFSGTIGGSKVQGRLAVRFGEAARVDGAIETASLDLPALIAAAIGMPVQSSRRGDAAAWSSEPFAPSASDLAGRIEFKARRAALTPALAARQLRGVARFDRSEVVFEDVDGELANGRLNGRLAFVTGADGISARARVALRDADAAAVVPGHSLQSPIVGRLAFEVEIEGVGRSPAAFIGSLAGSGRITLDDAQFAGLNPRVFDAVIRAVELGIPTDTNRIRDFVSTALDNGKLPASRAEAAIAINAGVARFTDIVTSTSGANLAVTASVDLTDATLDALLTLSGMPTMGGAAPPLVSVALKGPLPASNAPMTLKRTIDASALTSWLALRAVEQQSKQLDAMEQARREALAPTAEPTRSAPHDTRTGPPSSATGMTSPAPTTSMESTSDLPAAERALPLPPALNVLPTPRPRAAPRAETTAPPPRGATSRNPGPPPPSAPLDLLGAQH